MKRIFLIICLLLIASPCSGFVKETNISRYIGTSSESKPTDVLAGSLFVETDTGVVYKFTGSAWFVNNEVLGDGDGSAVGVQTPLPVDGDSIYAKDLDLDNSDIGTFTGDISTLFNDYHTEITDTTATNPKTFTIHFKRPVKSNKIGLGSLTGDFSNVKLFLKDIAGTVRQTIDDSANNNKLTSNLLEFTSQAFIEVVVEFHTADPVKISGALIPKALSRSISAIDGIISSDNSTETPLGISGVFTGDPIDTKDYGMVLCSVYSDVASATDGLSLQFSKDKTNWFWTDVYTIAAATGKTFSVQTQARWFRVVYTNGGVGQATFQLETTLKPVYVKPSSHRVGDGITEEDDAELVKSVITGAKPTGDFVNFQATTAGNFKMSLEELESGISSNANSQLNITQFDSSGNELFDQTTNPGYVKLTDGTNDVDVLSYEGGKSLSMNVAHKSAFSVHFSVQAASSTVGYMLVDLSDTANWPHTNTGHIILDQVVISTNQSASPAFLGDVQFGFLSNVDATNGDFFRIGTLHGDRGTPIGSGVFDFSIYGFDLEADEWFGPTTANDTTWQTDVDLIGPDGTTAYPSGDGDLVMKLVSSAGTIDMSATLFYTTRP